jgi:hypothetical protein
MVIEQPQKIAHRLIILEVLNNTFSLLSISIICITKSYELEKNHPTSYERHGHLPRETRLAFSKLQDNQAEALCLSHQKDRPPPAVPHDLKGHE